MTWWRSAVIYQIYVRSFADSDGDGVGDLAGVRSRLPYLRDLGVDALWFNPWYLSPWVDGGYDVTDYRSIDPVLGTLAEAEELIGEAQELGLRTIVDVVPNHVSDQHQWFVDALASEPGSAERSRFWFRPGAGDSGELPPNGWVSHFGGPAWTRTKDADGVPGEWYLHLFAPEQPDLNWDHPEVRQEHEDVLRFWFDRGAAGIRVDSAALLAKDPSLPEVEPDAAPTEHPYVDRDELHEIYRGWRSAADSYAEPRVLIGELWLPDPQRMARYLRPDELHTAFNFEFLSSPWEAVRLRECIESTLASHREVGAPATWVLANHDVTRQVTRLGRAATSFAFETKRAGVETDPALGLRRARAAALLAMALPGSLYVYQGEELGLPEVENLDPEWIRDPMHHRSGGVDPGRDGARVPIPWSGSEQPFGFSPESASSATWLPQPEGWASLTVEVQDADPRSTLSLYRAGLAIRRQELGDGDLRWLDSPADVLAFARDDFVCITNLSDRPVPLPAHDRVLLSSAPLDGDRLATDTTAWLRLGTNTDNAAPAAERHRGATQ